MVAWSGYRGDDNERNAQALYDNIITSYGLGDGCSPFVSDFNVTVPSSGAPQGLGGLLFNLATKSFFGTQQSPFRLVNPLERPAGDLGAYGLSRFEGNSARMGLASSMASAQSTQALSNLVAGSFGRDLFGEENAAKIADVIKEDPMGMVSMLAPQAARLLGAGADYGITSIKAAKHAEALMTADEREALNNTEYGSEQWKSLINNSTSRFTKAARSLMYEKDGNSFVRKEDFMRGFAEDDVSSILERVVASASGNEDMKDRMQRVGGAAIKTLEAFKELFGSADKAKQVMNAITGGGFASMSEQDFERLTNTTRGIMELGNKAGVSNTAVANMVQTASAGVTQAMGYSASDIAGGYVNNKYVAAVADQFVAQELKNLGKSSLDELDPTTQARVQAQATWRATQFAGSSANKFMTAAVYAKKNGIMSDETFARVKDLFSSGDEESMRQGADIVASSMNMDKDEILDTTHFKIFADDVASDSESLDELIDMGITASNNEDRNRTEKAIANVGIDRAKRAATIAGIKDAEQEKIQKDARLGSIVKNLDKFAENGDPTADYVRKAMQHAGDDPDKQLKVFENMKGMLAPGLSDYVEANANAATANELNARAYESSNIGGSIAEAAKKFGARLDKNGTLNRVDAGKMFKGLADAFRAEGDKEKADRINTLLEKGNFRELERQFGNQFTDDRFKLRGDAVLSNVGFSEKPQDIVGTTRQTFSDILSNKNGFRYESSRSGKTDEDVVKAITSTIDKVSSTSDEEVGKLKEEAGKAEEKRLLAAAKLKEADESVEKVEGSSKYKKAVESKKKAVENLSNANKKNEEAVVAEQKATEEAEKATEEAAKFSDDDMSDEAVSARSRRDSTKKDLEKARSDKKKAADELEKAQKAANKASKEVDKLETPEYKNAVEEQKSAKKDLETAEKEEKEAKKKVEDAEKASEKRKKSLDNIKPIREAIENAKTPEELQAALNDLDEFMSKKENGELASDLRKSAKDEDRVVFSGEISKKNEAFFVGDTKINLSDKEVAADIKRATQGTGLSGMSAEQVMNAITANTDNLSDEEKQDIEKVRGRLSSSRTFVERDREEATGTTKLTQQSATADLANSGFDGALVAVNKFASAISDLGKNAPVTTEELRKLGAAITEIVDSNAGKNKSLMQAAAQWLEATTDEEKDAAAEAMRSAIKNPGMSDDTFNGVVDKLSEAIDGIGEKFDVSAIVTSLEDLPTKIGDVIAANLQPGGD